MRVSVKLLGFVFWLFYFNCHQCQAKTKLCRDLSVENGFTYIHPSNRDEIFYSCNTRYKPFSGNWWDSVTCRNGFLLEEPRCIPEEKCGAFPSVDHGKPNQSKKTFRDGETAELECEVGFKSTNIKCVRGTWEMSHVTNSKTPVCEDDVRCDNPEEVENAFITSKPLKFYVDGSSVTYKCRSSYLMNGKDTVFCRSGTWEETPTCKEVTCPLNTISEDLKIERPPNTEDPVKPGQKVTFSCKGRGMRLKGQSEITCQTNGEWSSPFPTCEEVRCVANLTVNMRSDGLPGPVSIKPGQTITLSCVGAESKLQGKSNIICLQSGEWNFPFPKCVGGKCKSPPSVNFGDTIDIAKNEYNSGESVEYACFSKYTLDLHPPYSRYLICEEGEWKGNIKCLKPCTVTVEEMDKRGIELRWGGRQKIFSPHEDRITFACQRRKYLKVNDLIQTCNDGVMTLPECE